jgi:hypothetical protein
MTYCAKQPPPPPTRTFLPPKRLTTFMESPFWLSAALCAHSVNLVHTVQSFTFQFYFFFSLKLSFSNTNKCKLNYSFKLIQFYYLTELKWAPSNLKKCSAINRCGKNCLVPMFMDVQAPVFRPRLSGPLSTWAWTSSCWARTSKILNIYFQDSGASKPSQ